MNKIILKQIIAIITLLSIEFIFIYFKLPVNRFLPIAFLFVLVIFLIIKAFSKNNRAKKILVSLSGIIIFIASSFIITRSLNSPLLFEKDLAVNVDYQSYNWKKAKPIDVGMDEKEVNSVISNAKKLDFTRALLVVKDDKLVVEEYFNSAASNQAFNCMSVTKSFTSALTGIAVDKGYIKAIDTKIVDFFPEYEKYFDDIRKQKVSIRDLITMKSGFDYDDRMRPVFRGNNWTKNSLAIPMENEPGKAFRYSTMQTYLLGVILEKSVKMSSKEFATKYLCEPIGISIADWVASPEGHYSTGGGLYLTPRDMARFGDLFLKKGNISGKQIISERWIEESIQSYCTENEVAYNNYNPCFKVTGYGFSWWIGQVNEINIYTAMGYGGQLIMVVPEKRMIIVLSSDWNTTPKNEIKRANNLDLIICGIIDAIK